MWGSFIIQLMGLILFQVKHAVSTDEPNPSMHKENTFRPFKDHELAETTPLAVVTASSPTHCAFHCTAVDKCESFDYAHAHGPQHRCEINSGSKSTSPSKFVRKTGYTHYEIERPPQVCIVKGFSGNFTTLGATGKSGPSNLSSHYDGKDQDGQVTLNSGIQLWTVPQSAKYRIEAVGASGGYGTKSSSAVRGRGARIIGNVDLVKGEIIKVLVGQEGQINTQDPSGGGGGGSFVVRGTDTPLIVAGGGGGVEHLSSRQEGCDANASTSGNRGHDPELTWPGGSDGQGATISDDSYAGGGGGGLYSDGRSGTNFGGTGAQGGEGGKGFVNGGVGGRSYFYEAAGGFGGGGGSYGAAGGAGGGGGYSGGASGNNNVNACAGGGGSYNVGSNPMNECCFNGEGDGYVLIQQLECS